MIVLDASALLALINHEPGWDVVARTAAGEDATISAIKYSEVLQKSARVGIAAEVIDGALEGLAITVTPFATSFYRHRSNLSLADRVPGPRPQPGQPRVPHRPPVRALGGRLRRNRGCPRPAEDMSVDAAVVLSLVLRSVPDPAADG